VSSAAVRLEKPKTKQSIGFIRQGVLYQSGLFGGVHAWIKEILGYSLQPNIPPVMISMQKFRKNKINAPGDSTPGALNQLPYSGTEP
jgi:hypothetical protein